MIWSDLTQRPPTGAEAAQAETARELSETRKRLAELEFRNLIYELETGLPEIVVTAEDAGTGPPPLHRADHAALAALGLPPLNVPLGRIAHVQSPGNLPVLAIRVPDRPLADLQRAFIGLFTEFNRSPFARLLFLSETADVLPFLARYGFACEMPEQSAGGPDFDALDARYRFGQVRDLLDGRLFWSATAAPQPRARAPGSALPP